MLINRRLIDAVLAWSNRKNKNQSGSFLKFLVEYDANLFSHHPPGSQFREHVWVFKGLYFCKGCVVTLAGILAGLIIEVLTHWLYKLSVFHVALVFCLLLLPTVSAAFSPKCPRPVKHIARFLLGVVTCSAMWFLFVTDSWLLRLVVVAVYLGVKLPLERKRVRNNAIFLKGNDRRGISTKTRRNSHAGCDCQKKY